MQKQIQSKYSLLVFGQVREAGIKFDEAIHLTDLVIGMYLEGKHEELSGMLAKNFDVTVTYDILEILGIDSIFGK